MKIAIPTKERKLAMHFGHCDEFAIAEVDATSKTIPEIEYAPPPMHEPGALPKWLNEKGVEVVIAGGMGSRAQQLLAQFGIESIVGSAQGTPEDLINSYLNGRLQSGENICTH